MGGQETSDIHNFAIRSTSHHTSPHRRRRPLAGALTVFTGRLLGAVRRLPSRPGFDVARAAMICLLGIAVLSVPDSAQAQTEQTLVSNLDTSTSSSVGVQSSEHAQQFRTGSGAAVRLSEVEAYSLGGGTNSSNLGVSLWSSVSGAPGEKIVTFSNPSDMTSRGLKTFTNPDPRALILQPSTSYFVVFSFRGTTGGPFNLGLKPDTEETGLSGWTVADFRRTRDNAGALTASWTANAIDLPVGIRLRGSFPTPPALLAAEPTARGTILNDDTTAPEFVSAHMSRSSVLVLTYDSELDSASIPAPSAFTVTVGGTTVTVQYLAVYSGSVQSMTLELNATVVPGQSVVISYTPPSTNPIQDLAGNDAGALTNETVANPDDTTGPELVFAQMSTTVVDELLLTFDEDLDIGSVPAASAFDVTVAGVARPVISVAFGGSKWSISVYLASPVLEDQTVLVTYTMPDVNPIRDVAGNAAANFTDRKAANDITPDITAPEFTSAEMSNYDWLYLRFDEDLDIGSVPAASAFDVTVAGAARAVDRVSFFGGSKRIIELYLASPVLADQTVLLTYTMPDVNPLRDVVGNAAASFTDREVTNYIPADTTAPELASAEMSNSLELLLTYDSDLDSTSTPALSAFTVTVAGTTVTVTNVSVYRYGGSVTLTLDATVVPGQSVAVSYIPPSINPIQDVAGNDAGALTNETVANPADATVPELASAHMSTTVVDELLLTFDEELDIGSVPAASAFAVTVAGAARAVNRVSFFGDSKMIITLYLASPVLEDETVLLTYTMPDVNPIRDVAGNAAANFTDREVRNDITADTTAPELDSAEMSSSSVLSLEFDSPLDTASRPATSAFTVTVAGATVTVRSVSVYSGGSVTLTLGATVVPGQSVAVSYTPPSTDPIQDLAGNDAVAFTNLTVANPADTTAPVISVARVNTTERRKLDLEFEEDLDIGSVPAAAAFEVTVAGAARDVYFVQFYFGNKRHLELTLASPVVLAGQTVLLTYTMPAVDPIRDVAGNDAASFTNREVTNDIPVDTTPPELESAYMLSSWELILQYDSELSGLSSSPPSAFTVTVAGTTVRVTRVQKEHRDMRLSLDATVVPGQSVAVSYMPPSTNPIQDLSGNDAGAFTNVTVANPDDTSAPEVSTVTTYNWLPDTLYLTFDEDLDPGSVPAASAFDVTVAGVARPVLSVAFTGLGNRRSISVDLAWPIVSGQTVLLTYTKPVADPIQDVAGNDAASFTDHAVTNNVRVDTTAPELESAYMRNSSVLVLQYDSHLDTTSSPAPSAFTVTVAGTTVTVRSVSVWVLGNLNLDLHATVIPGQSVAVSYMPPSTNPIQDLSGNDAGAFTNETVPNPDDTTAPEFDSAYMSTVEDLLFLTVDEDLDRGSVPAASAFDVTVAGAARAVNRVAILSKRHIRLYLASPVLEDQTVLVTYTMPDVNPIRDLAGNAAASFTDREVRNDITADTTAPELDSAEMSRSSLLVLTYDSDLDTTSSPATSAFTVTAAGATATVTHLSVGGNRVTLTLDATVVPGQSVAVSYMPPSINPIEDLAGNAAGALTNETVANPADATAPELFAAYMRPVVDELLLTFDEDLDIGSVPAASAFDVTVAGADRAVNRVSFFEDSKRHITLYLASPVLEDETVLLTYTMPDVNPIRDVAGNTAANFTDREVRNDITADTTAPELDSAEMSSSSVLVLRYDSHLDTTSTPATSAFTVTAAGATVTVRYVSVGGSRVALTLDATVVPGQSVAISYMPPSINPIQDLAGNVAGAFTNETVANPDETTAPELSARIDTKYRDQMFLTSDEDLDRGSAPAVSAFEVTVAGAAVAVNHVSFFGGSKRTIELILASPVLEDQTVLLTYTMPADNPIRDVAGNAAASFTDRAVANDTRADTTAPMFLRAENYPWHPIYVTVFFDEPVLVNPQPGKSAFEATVAGADREVFDTTVREFDYRNYADTMRLVLLKAPRAGETVTVSYTPPATNAIVDQAGNRMAAFSNRTVTNQAAVDTTAPVLQNAAFLGQDLVLTYDERLHILTLPSPGAYQVTADGVPVTVSTVKYHASVASSEGIARGAAWAKVALRLATAIRPEQVVRISYTVPATNPVEDFGWNAAAALDNEPVASLSPTAPSVTSIKSDAIHPTKDAFEVTITFSKPVTGLLSRPGLVVNAIEVTNGAGSEVSGSGTTYALTVTPDEDFEGEVTVTVPPAVVADAAGTVNTVGSARTFGVDTRAPALAITDGATVNGATLTLTFDETLAAANPPPASAFDVTVAGAARAVDRVSFFGDSKRHMTLYLASPVLEDQTVLVTYTMPNVNPIRDVAGNAAASFTDREVRNDITADTTAPELSSAEMSRSSALVLTYDSELDSASIPAPSAFTVTVAGTTVTVTNVSVYSGGSVTLTLDATVVPGQGVAVSYMPPSINPIQDVAGNDAGALTNETVANPADTTAPELDSADMSTLADRLYLYFDEDLDRGSVPAASAFDVTVAGADRAVHSVSFRGDSKRYMTLYLASPVLADQTVLVTYTMPDVNPIRDVAGNAAASFTDREVRNDITVDTTAPELDSAEMSSSSVLVLRYDSHLDSTSTPAPSAFTVTVAGTTVTVRHVSVYQYGGSVTLTLDATVVPGQSVAISYMPPSTNPIQDVAGNAAGALTNETVANPADTTAPELDSADMSTLADRLYLYFDEDLDRGSVPAASAFDVTVAGADRAVDSVSFRGDSKRYMTLYLASPVLADQTVLVTYTMPDVNPIRDVAGNAAASFTDREVRNDITADTTAPELASAEMSSSSVLVLTYDSRLDSASIPAPSAFTVTVAGTTVTVTNVSVYSGGSVTLTLDATVVPGQSVAISYMPPPTNPIQDVAGNDAGALTNETVANPADTTAPELDSAEMSSSSVLVLRYDSRLDSTSTPATSAFTVTVAGATVTVRHVSVYQYGGSVTLTLDATVVPGQSVAVSYMPPSINPIEDLAGNAAGALTNETVANPDDTTAPEISLVYVYRTSRDRLYLEFDEDLDRGSVPAASAFEVTVAGAARAVNHASFLGGKRTIRLFLASPVLEDQTVLLTYTMPDVNPIRDVAGNAAASFTDREVTNDTRADTTAPMFVRAENYPWHPIYLLVFFDEPVLVNPLPDESAFEVTVAGADREVFDTVGREFAYRNYADTMELALLKAPRAGETVTVSYTPPATNAIVDQAGNLMAAFSNRTVTNQAAVDTTAPVLQNAAFLGQDLVLTYNERLHIFTLPSPGAYRVTANGAPVTVSTVSHHPSVVFSEPTARATGWHKVALYLASPVPAGQTVLVTYTVPATNPVEDFGWNAAAALDNEPVASLSPTAPSVTSIKSDASHPTKDAFEVTITFSKPVTGLLSLPGLVVSAIEVTNGVASEVSGSGTTYALTVTPDEDFEGDVTVTVPPAVVADAAGTVNTVGSARAFRVDTRAPALAIADGATVNGATLTLTFDETLAAANPPPASAFTVTGAAARSVTGVAVVGAAVRLTLSAAVPHGETGIAVDYAAPSENALADVLGNEVASITDRAVINNTPQACAPNPDDIWCGVVTVMAYSIPGDESYDGFLESEAGNLSEKNFTYGENRYTIDAIGVGKPTEAGEGRFLFSLTSELTESDKAALVLYVGSTAIPLDVSGYFEGGGGHFYFWEGDAAQEGGLITPGPGLDWTSETTVTVRLREASTTCTLQDAIWCGVVTPGDLAGEYGFLNDIGLLSDTDFEYDSTPYTIDEVSVSEDSGQLRFSLTADLTAAHRAALELHVDGSSGSFALQSASHVAGSNTYEWTDTGLDWSSVPPVTLRLRDRDTAPTFPGKPTNLTATANGSTQIDLGWDAPDPGTDPITGYRIEVWADAVTGWTDLVANTGNADTTYVHTGLSAGDTRHYRVSAINTNGPSVPSDESSATTLANAPVFADATATRTVAENSAADTNVGDAFPEAMDEDGDPLTYSMEGMDTASFTFDASARQIKTRTGVLYNYEAAKNTYSVTVKADDGTGGTDTIAVTITLTNVLEQPDQPARPTLAAVSGSTTSLEMSWVKPGLNGGPAIIGYAVQYQSRVSATDPWGGVVAWPHSGTGTTATITGLTADTEYQVQVRALNGETPSAWSDPSDAARTNAEMSTLAAPTNLTATPGDAQVALAWEAPAPDSGVTRHEFRYKTDGSYPASWTKIANSAVGGVNEASYTVTGLTNGTAYTFELRAVGAGEGAAAAVGPVTPVASGGTCTDNDIDLVRGEVNSEGSVQICHDAEWRSVCDDGLDIGNNGPAFAGVVCRQSGYATGEATLGSEFGEIFPVRFWLDDVVCTGTEANLGLCEHADWGVHNCAFSERAGVRCTVAVSNLEAVGSNNQVSLAWDAPGNDAGITRHEVRYKTATGSYPAAWTAIPDSAANGANAASYTVTGLAIATDYILQVRIVGGGNASRPAADYARTNGTTASTDATLSALVVNDGSMDLTLSPSFVPDKYTYDASVTSAVAEVTVTPTRSEASAALAWLDGNDMALADADTTKDEFQVALAVGDTVIQVKVTAGDGDATQTYTVTVNRAAPPNNAPVFADATATRMVAENSAADTNVGDAFPEAMDEDGDTLTYSMEGMDTASFTFDASARQIKTQTGVVYNYEAAKNTYSVTVKADDGTGGTGTIAVTITLTDMLEKSAKPAKPTVTATAGTTDSLNVSWVKPGLNGGPDLTGYGVQYRQGSRNWQNFTHVGAATTTTITGLSANTEYQVQVRALNDETPSDWSDPSDAVRTNAVALPVVSVGDASATEGSPVTFTVTLSEAVTDNVTVNWATTGDTATSDTDFTAANGTLTIAAGDQTATVEVATAEDTTDEDDETFTLTLSSPSLNAEISDATAVGTITDDDDAPTLSVEDQTVNEGDQDPENLLPDTDDGFPFRVTLSAASEKQVRYKIRRVELASDTATAADLDDDDPLYPGTSAISPGDTVSIRGGNVILNDDLDEPDETFTLEIYDIENATAGAQTRSTITIEDDDDPPSVSVGDATAAEGAPVEFPVTLSAASGREVAVNWATTGDTATSPADFTAASGTLTVMPGETTATVAVATEDDTLDEPDETFTLTLSSPSNATLGEATATGTITDNDDPPTLGVADAAATEGAPVEFTVTLSAAATADVTATWTASTIEGDEEKAAAADLESTTGSVTVPRGETTATFTVATAEDALDENNETFTVALSSPSSNATLAADATTATGTITDDDNRPALIIADVSAPEDSNVEFTVTLTPASGRTVTVAWGTFLNIGQTAEEEDFTGFPQNGFVTFPPGQTTAQLQVGVVDDELVESDETFEVTLGSASNARLEDNSATGTIVDNDVAPNAAPSFDSLTTFDAAENQTAVGTVAASDDDTDDDITGYEISGGADQALFAIDKTNGALTFLTAPNYEDPQDANTDNAYLVTVQATSGTGDRELMATQTITVTVMDDDTEAPAAPGAPSVSAVSGSVTSLNVSWTAPDNAGPEITDYDYRYQTTSPPGAWVEVTNTTIAVLSATIAGLAENTEYDVQVRATNDEGTGGWSASGSGRTDANAAPSFDSPPTFDAAENQTSVGTVVASDDDTGDEVTGYEISGGADQALFAIDKTNGALTFLTAPNYEDPQDANTDNAYLVTVQATSGTGDRELTATQTITVTVTDDDTEAPAAPGAPSVSAVSGSVTSLTVTWLAPDNAGPAITDYDYRYRTTLPPGAWVEVTNTTITALSATIAGLAENTEYDVQVRATNDEGTSGWSDSGSGTTDANAAPSFTSSATFNPAENQTAVGTVRASDSDASDDITGYELTGGADQALFSIVSTSGVLTFQAAPNYEDPQDANTDNAYVVVVQATSGTGDREKTGTQTITVTVTDVNTEAPSAPDAPSVSAASVTSLNVSWTAPANAGPEITDYDYRYQTTSPPGAWVEVTNTTITALGATIAGLAENTEYDVQVRATNAEGTGGWSASGSGTTDANAAPSFDSPPTFDAAENQTAVGTVRASDSDASDAITGYELTGGADQSFFSIGSDSGVLTFDDAPNFEAPSDAGTNGSYAVTVQATSGTGARVRTATQTITVTVTDVNTEAPSAPTAPSVSAASVSSLNVSWTAPANAGPEITDYDYRYQTTSPPGAWVEVTNTTITALSATIAGLAENTEYDVQVRATNDEGTGGWSASGSGTTDANAAPSFDSPPTFDAAENQTAVGTVRASDSDASDAITGYELTGGADQSFFSIGSDSGVLTFNDAPNFEAPSDAGTNGSYAVTVQATSGTGARVRTATQTITVTVTDVNTEAPSAPTAPSVSAASVTSLNVSWTAPANAGPEITDYDYRYRTTSPPGAWGEVTNTTITASSATITGLAENTEYDVQVRATNDEGTGGWSNSGSGTTDAVPSLTDATLSALVVKDGSRDLMLRPDFAPGTTSYRVWVANAVADVTVTPTLNDAGARIDWLDGSDMTLADADPGEDEFQVTLAEGDNVVKVKVTAKDRITTRTYTVTVTRRAVAAVDDAGEEGQFRLAPETVDDYSDTTEGHLNGKVGRAEVFHAGRWGTVCDDGFSRDAITDSLAVNNAPALLCQSMGYHTGEYASGYGQPGVPAQPSGRGMTYYPVGSTYPADEPDPIWVDDMTCAAGDADLGAGALPAPMAHCGYAGWGLHNCSHNEDAGVRCWNESGSAMAGGRALPPLLPPLTASFEGVPRAHDGEGAFRFRVAFSEDIGISYRSMSDAAFTVSGGAVTRARRVDGRRDLWEITVVPDSDGDVAIALPGGRECGVSGAICTRGENRRRLANTPTATVKPVLLGDVTVRLEGGRRLSATVPGPATARRLSGSADDDTLSGRAGDDILYGDDDDSGAASGDDLLDGGDGDDTLHGGGGHDELYGGGGDDALYGDDDDSGAASGDDILYGDGGDDVLLGGDDDDALHGGGGHDELYGDDDDSGAASGDDLLDGGSGDDILYGDGGDDVLEGGADDDTLDGGAGLDTLYGDGGADSLTGGTGADTFVFAAGDGTDTITDFFPEEGDRIDLSAFAGLEGFASLTLTSDGSATILDLRAHGGGTVRLEGIAVTDLLAADFLWS